MLPRCPRGQAHQVEQQPAQQRAERRPQQGRGRQDGFGRGEFGCDRQCLPAPRSVADLENAGEGFLRLPIQWLECQGETSWLDIQPLGCGIDDRVGAVGKEVGSMDV